MWGKIRKYRNNQWLIFGCINDGERLGYVSIYLSHRNKEIIKYTSFEVYGTLASAVWNLNQKGGSFAGQTFDMWHTYKWVQINLSMDKCYNKHHLPVQTNKPTETTIMTSMKTLFPIIKLFLSRISKASFHWWASHGSCSFYTWNRPL